MGIGEVVEKMMKDEVRGMMMVVVLVIRDSSGIDAEGNSDYDSCLCGDGKGNRASHKAGGDGDG